MFLQNNMTDQVTGEVTATIETNDQSAELELLRAQLAEKEAQIAEKDSFARQAIARAKAAEEKTKIITNPDKDESIDEEVDLRLDGYTKEEAKFIRANGGRAALEDKDSFVAAAIERKREQREAELNASKAKDTSQMTAFEKKYTPEQLAKMTASELEKILPHSGN